MSQINPLNGRVLIRSLTYPLVSPETAHGLHATRHLQIETDGVPVRVTPEELQRLRCWAMGGTDCD